MKKPNKIKKGLECCAKSEGCPQDCPYYDVPSCGSTLKLDALAYIQQLEQINADFAERTARLEAQVAKVAKVAKDINVPAWISVNERFPEDDVDVLVYAIGNNEHSIIAMTSYTHSMYGYNIEGWHAPWQYFFHEYKITHWMPLPNTEGINNDMPEPPKEG